jgi:ribosomal protein S25
MTDQPDWERIEQLYRAGVLSLREIAAACPGSNHMAIARRAKKLGWTQDLAAKIKAKAEDLVTRQLVTESVTADRAVTDRVVIDVNAQAIVNVRLGHRTDISRSRRIANKLLDELESLTDEHGTIKELIQHLKEGDYEDGDAMADMLSLTGKIAALPSRSKTLKELSETLKTLILLERQAYNLDTLPDGGDSADASLTIQFVKPSNGN